MEALCQIYWYPLYALIRSQGFQADEAQDLTQEFFVRLLDRDGLRSVDREKGRFRAWLVGAVRHFLSNARDHKRAKKRGGRCSVLRLDFQDAEGRLQLDPIHDESPERLFARQWATTLLEYVLRQVRDEYSASGKDVLFEELKPFLQGTECAPSHREIAARLEMTEGAVKIAVHRLRKRYRELLREEILRTVADPADVDDEIQELFFALRP